MKKIKNIVFVLMALFISCMGSEFESKQIIGNYYLTSTDNFNKEAYIDYKLKSDDFIGIIPSAVFSVGHNDNYIVAKQSDFNLKNQSDSQIINYYIIKILTDTISPENGVTGPLTSKQYELKRIRD
ncbi:hypothetical protein FQZ97_712060 [compost metagenome]